MMRATTNQQCPKLVFLVLFGLRNRGSPYRITIPPTKTSKVGAVQQPQEQHGRLSHCSPAHVLVLVTFTTKNSHKETFF